MRDTQAFLYKDKRIILLSFQGSTIYFNLSRLPFAPADVEVNSEVRDMNGNKVANFSINKKTDSIDFEIPYFVSENLIPTDVYVSEANIFKVLPKLTKGKYYFDVEVLENGKKYKLLVGILVVVSEQTKEEIT